MSDIKCLCERCELHQPEIWDSTVFAEKRHILGLYQFCDDCLTRVLRMIEEPEPLSDDEIAVLRRFASGEKRVRVRFCYDCGVWESLDITECLECGDKAHIAWGLLGPGGGYTDSDGWFYILEWLRENVRRVREQVPA